MPSNYWLKLYHEILDDPKMGRLDDHLFRRVIEVFLLAGDLGTERGELPSVEDMAWRLRCTEQELCEDIAELLNVGILSSDGDFPGKKPVYVTQWSQRQAPASPAERQQRHRKRSRTKQYYGNEDVTERDEPRNEPVTTRNTELDLDTDIEVQAEPGSAVPAAVAPPVSPHGAYFTALSDVCQLDSGVKSNAGRMNRAAKELRDANVALDEIQRFYVGSDSWWWTENWKGQKDEPPTPEDIGKTIGIARTWASHNGKPRDGPLERFWGEDNNGNRVELTR